MNVAQSEERRIVKPKVARSKLVIHPSSMILFRIFIESVKPHRKFKFGEVVGQVVYLFSTGLKPQRDRFDSVLHHKYTRS